MFRENVYQTRRGRLLAFIHCVAVALAVQACGSDRDSVNCASSEQETSTARDAWLAAIGDANYCDVDADCAVYTESLQCLYHCGAAVSAAETENLSDLAGELRERLDMCDAGPCPIPTCAPRPDEVVCVESRCEFSANGTSSF